MQQNDEKSSGGRGATRFAADFDRSFRAVIGLFHGKANATTLPHEAAHRLLRMMEAMVKGGYADGAAVLVHNPENGRLSERLKHLTSVENKVTGEP